ncbi:hypothetical protein BH23ACT2_BH23ACT2_00570 [soil metagenome]
MLIHLIRHAHAGPRRAWAGPDDQRPLSERGQAQAAVIDRALADAEITLLWSSRFVRCVETLDPLAHRRGLTVATTAELTEGGSGADALDALLAAAAEGHTLAACSHGDVIPAVVAAAVGRGATLDGPASPSKAARYELTVDRGQVTHLAHVPAPDGRD